MFSSSSISELDPTVEPPSSMFPSIIWTILYSVFCIALIYGAHRLWLIVQSTYSSKRTAGSRDKQIEKYKKIIDEMQHRNERGLSHYVPTDDTDEPLFSSEQEKDDMMRTLLQL